MTHRVRQMLESLSLKDLRQLNHEFGLPSTGNQKTLIERLIGGPSQFGGGRPEHAKVEALEGLLSQYIDWENTIPETVSENDIRIAAADVDLQLDYSPIEWYQILADPEIKTGERPTTFTPEGILPPFQALSAYAERFAKKQLSELSYPQLKELQKIYPGHFNDNLITATATEKMKLLRNWLSEYHHHYTIDELSELKDLNIHDNRLTNLPPEIGQLTNLVKLTSSHNILTSLPAEIGQLTNLKQLYLVDNQLTSLPAEIGQLTNLEHLYLFDNRLTSLPAEIGQLTNLKYLYLGRNRLTSLPAEIGQLTNLVELILNSNKLTSLPSEIGKLKLNYLSVLANPNLVIDSKLLSKLKQIPQFYVNLNITKTDSY